VAWFFAADGKIPETVVTVEVNSSTTGWCSSHQIRMKSSWCLTQTETVLLRVPTQYQVRDDTDIKHIPNPKLLPMSRFLSHDKTKADLTDCLAAKTL